MDAKTAAGVKKKPSADTRPYRHELKYIISEGEHAILSRRLSMTMAQDSNVNEQGEYFIRSLYFDDPYNTALQEKEDGVQVRDKFRIRIYNNSDKVIKLERKHKHDQFIAKSSLSLTRQECESILAGDYQFLLDRPEQFAGEMFYQFTVNRLRPKVIVDYDREPYVFPVEDVRITFDKNIRTAMRATDIFNPDLPTYPVWDLKNCMVLEVKFNQYLPAYIRTLIQLGASEHTAVSKYVYSRQYEF